MLVGQSLTDDLTLLTLDASYSHGVDKEFGLVMVNMSQKNENKWT